jgi:hypothetical protein
MSDDLDGKPVRWLGTPEGLAQLREVDVVFAVDRATGKETLVFGRSLLRDGYEGPTGLACRVLRVPVDMETDELEVVRAACLVAKGSYDLQS